MHVPNAMFLAMVAQEQEMIIVMFVQLVIMITMEYVKIVALMSFLQMTQP